MSRLAFQCAARIVAVALVMALVGLMAVQDSPMASADDREGSWVHSCPETINEGESGRLGVGAAINAHTLAYTVFLWTYSGTAKSGVDFIKHKGTPFRFDSSPAYFDIETLEDDIPEGDETFRVSWRVGGDVFRECHMTIIDDDPHITGIEIVSKPLAGDTYGMGDTIEFAATFNAEVEVNGNALMGFYIGDRWEGAWHQRGSGTDTLVFGYTVKGDDVDEDGVSVHNGYVDRNGRQHGFGGSGKIVGKDTDVPAYPWYDGIPDQPGHKIDGYQIPLVADMQVVSTPRNGSFYREGEKISIEVTYSSPVVVTSDPSVHLKFDDNQGSPNRTADVAVVAGNRVTFRYTVTKVDVDHNGLSFGGIHNALENIRADRDDMVIWASENYEGLLQKDIAGQAVDGRLYVTDIDVTSSPSRGVYANGDVIQVTLKYNKNVGVQGGTPRIRLQIGPDGRQSSVKEAGYVSSSSSESLDTDTLHFQYKVQEGDEDSDGISILAGDEEFGFGAPAYLGDPGSSAKASPLWAAQNNLGGHKVDGVTPSVSSVQIISDPGDDQTYGVGDVIGIRVTFSEGVTVSGAPQIGLTIGEAVRQADYAGATGPQTRAKPKSNDTSASATNQLMKSSTVSFFTYTVAVGDEDDDGIAIGESTLDLNGGSIEDGAGNDADLAHDAVADDSGHKVSADIGGL